MKLKKTDLEGVKLANDEYFASPEEAADFLERGFQQASQGWGVRREVGVCLTLARDLLIAWELADTADEAQRMLKGAQMETGRLKKKIEKLEAELLAAKIENSKKGD
jgi:hypothetical protein